MELLEELKELEELEPLEELDKLELLELELLDELELLELELLDELELDELELLDSSHVNSLYADAVRVPSHVTLPLTPLPPNSERFITPAIALDPLDIVKPSLSKKYTYSVPPIPSTSPNTLQSGNVSTVAPYTIQFEKCAFIVALEVSRS